MKKSIQLILLLLMINITTSVVYPQQVKNELPERKQTTLGLYVTANEAYNMWKANPDKVTVLDIRTVVEYIWVGHPEMSLTIPAFNQTMRWDDQLKMFALEPDAAFLQQVEKRFAKDAIRFSAVRVTAAQELLICWQKQVIQKPIPLPMVLKGIWLLTLKTFFWASV